MKNNVNLYRKLTCFIFVLLLAFMLKSVAALSSTDNSTSLNEAAMKLIQFCMEPKTGLDEQAVAILVDYVMSPKESREHGLPKSLDSTGAYYEFDTKISFPRFIEYSYNPLIPPAMTRPSSLRYSVWTVSNDESKRLPGNWKQAVPGGAPVVIHGGQRESDTPDLNTGVYHEYDLKRTLIMLNHKGRQVMVSVSKQIKKSNVGKKGVILGNDSGWSYYYSGEPGTAKAGLGWVKSYIYDFFSIGIYAESSSSPDKVRTGVFQWLRAGWSGINFVKSNHIIGGLKRFSRDCRTNLESPLLPAPKQLASVYECLSNMSPGDLNKKYIALQQGIRSSAAQAGKISQSASGEEPSFSHLSKEQIIQEIMLEYLKLSLGKQTMLEKHFEIKQCAVQ